MQRKNWVFPGILVLAMLLLLSFPGFALAGDNAAPPEGQVISASPGAEPAGETGGNSNAAAQQDIIFEPAHSDPNVRPDAAPAADSPADTPAAPAPAPAADSPADTPAAPAPAPAADSPADTPAAPAPAPAADGPADTPAAPAPAPAADSPADTPAAPAPAPAADSPADTPAAPAPAPAADSPADTPAAPSPAPAPAPTPAPAMGSGGNASGVPAPTPEAGKQNQPGQNQQQPVVEPVTIGSPVITDENSNAAGTDVSIVPENSAAAPGYVVQPGDTLEKISEKTGVPVERLKETNGLHVDEKAVAQPQQPVDTNGQNSGSGPVSQGQDSTQVDDAALSLTYRVRKGESLWLIGRNLGIAYEDIMAANHLADYLIYPDQELVIPGLDLSNGVIKYRIKAGDTFYLIGQALGIDYEDLMSLNGFKDIWIYPDQELQIPVKKTAQVYKVQPGDTLTDVARKFAVDVKSILGLQDSSEQLHVGQVLVIPMAGETSQERTVAGTFSNAKTDLEMLARAIYAEARGELYKGQVAVGGVIMNRLKNAAFPKTIRDIILQPGAFSAVDDGQINLTPDAVAYKAAQEALNGADPSLGALYYWNPKVATSKWIWSRPIIAQIGNHVFAR